MNENNRAFNFSVKIAGHIKRLRGSEIQQYFGKELINFVYIK